MKKSIIFLVLLALFFLVSCQNETSISSKKSTSTTNTITTNITTSTEENKMIESLKVLSIGNSFGDDTFTEIPKFTKKLGIETTVGILFIGGCSLSTHLSNAKTNAANYEYRECINNTWTNTVGKTMLEGIKAQEWDYIFLQQQSSQAGVPSSFAPLEELIVYVKENATNKDFKLGWNMTWAYQADCTTNSGFSLFDYDQVKMYNAIVNATKEIIVPNEDFDLICPVGTAIQNVRNTSFGDKMTRDGYHLNMIFGRYLASYSLLRTIIGFDISEIVTYRNTMMPINYADIMKEAAEKAALKPFEVTK